jgi:dTDP-glucose 4,6-dehydratase
LHRIAQDDNLDGGSVNILVTGGAGFIGACFVTELLSNYSKKVDIQKVTVLDALTYASDLTRLDSVKNDQRLEILEGSILNRDLVAELVSAHDLVFNFAAESHVDNSINNPMEFLNTNVLGVQVLLDSLVANPSVRFVQVSTDEVYGEVLNGSSTEDSQINPSSPYSVSKAAAEMLIFAAARTHGIKYRITRGCNTYGPGQFPEKIIPLFIKLGLKHEAFPIYGDGQQSREWIHVKDHCKGIWLAANSLEDNQVFNIGSGLEMTNLDLANKISSILGHDKLNFENVRDRPGHDRRYFLDSSKAHKILGFKTGIDFQEGLMETIALASKTL